MTKITKLNGIAFLAFPEQKDFLVSELKERFGITDSRVKPGNDIGGVDVSLSGLTRQSLFYGDLLYYPDKSAFLESSGGAYPYWARTCMLDPFLL